MNMRKSSRAPEACHSRHYWPFLLLIILCVACNEREPGCLDIQAENFDFDADKDDRSLCNYPNLILNVLYQWQDSSLKTSRLYENSMGMLFVIHNVQILFSDFIVTGNGLESHVVDEVAIRKGTCETGTTEVIPDDFVFVDRSTFNFVLGGFRESGTMNSCQLNVGIPTDYLPMCATQLPTSHVLRRERAGYREEIGDFAVGRFVVSQDSVNAVRDTFFTYMNPTELGFPIGREFKRGKKDTLYMEIDFYEILNPIDWSKSSEEISDAIGAGIPAAVLVR
jgi:hypothetical protein